MNDLRNGSYFIKNFSIINEMKLYRIKKQLNEEQEPIKGDLIKVKRMIEYINDGENKEKYEKRLSELIKKCRILFSKSRYYKNK